MSLLVLWPKFWPCRRTELAQITRLAVLDPFPTKGDEIPMLLDQIVDVVDVFHHKVRIRLIIVMTNAAIARDGENALMYRVMKIIIISHYTICIKSICTIGKSRG